MDSAAQVREEQLFRPFNQAIPTDMSQVEASCSRNPAIRHSLRQAIGSPLHLFPSPRDGSFDQSPNARLNRDAGNRVLDLQVQNRPLSSIRRDDSWQSLMSLSRVGQVTPHNSRNGEFDTNRIALGYITNETNPEPQLNLLTLV